MGTEHVISVKSGIRYTYTRIWRRTLLMGYGMNSLSRNMGKQNYNYFVKRHSLEDSKTIAFTDIVVRPDGNNVFKLLQTSCTT